MQRRRRASHGVAAVKDSASAASSLPMKARDLSDGDPYDAPPQRQRVRGKRVSDGRGHQAQSALVEQERSRTKTRRRLDGTGVGATSDSDVGSQQRVSRSSRRLDVQNTSPLGGAFADGSHPALRNLSQVYVETSQRLDSETEQDTALESSPEIDGGHHQGTLLQAGRQRVRAGRRSGGSGFLVNQKPAREKAMQSTIGNGVVARNPRSPCNQLVVRVALHHASLHICISAPCAHRRRRPAAVTYPLAAPSPSEQGGKHYRHVAPARVAAHHQARGQERVRARGRQSSAANEARGARCATDRGKGGASGEGRR